jgi:hypothetical protein
MPHARLGNDAVTAPKTLGTTFRFAVLVVTTAAGCMSVPARYRAPLPRHVTAAPKRIAVEGFVRDVYRETGRAVATSYGQAQARAAAVGVGPGGAYAYDGTVRAAQSGLAVATQGEYVPTSDAEDIRGLLLETGCFRVTADPGSADLVVRGDADSHGALGAARTLVQVVEGLTLTPLFGVPVPGRVRGVATASVYTADGELVGRFGTEAYLSGWTTLYTAGQDKAKALAIVRGMAMRDLVARLADAACL